MHRTVEEETGDEHGFWGMNGMGNGSEIPVHSLSLHTLIVLCSLIQTALLLLLLFFGLSFNCTEYSVCTACTLLQTKKSLGK